MAAQGERVSGVVVMCSVVGEPMVQETPVQDIPIPMQEQFFPQMDPKPEMGVAAAAVYDTSPSLLRNPPPIPAETAHQSAPDMTQLFAMLAGMNAKMDTNAKEIKEELKEEIKNEMKANAQQMENKMETSTYEIKTNACRMNNKMNANLQQLKTE